MNKCIYIFILLAIIGISPIVASAQQVPEYELLTPLPIGGQGEVASSVPLATTGTEFADFLNNFITIIIAVAGVLAVIMIIVGGIKYITSESGGGKGSAKEYITGAVGGLILIFGSYLLLNTINPELVSFRGIERLYYNFYEGPSEPGWWFKDINTGAYIGPVDTLQQCDKAREEYVTNSTQSAAAASQLVVVSDCFEVTSTEANFCYFYFDKTWGIFENYEAKECFRSRSSCIQEQEEKRSDNTLIKECTTYERPNLRAQCLTYDENSRACYPISIDDKATNPASTCMAAADFIMSNNKTVVNYDGPYKGCSAGLEENPSDPDANKSQWCFAFDTNNQTTGKAKMISCKDTAENKYFKNRYECEGYAPGRIGEFQGFNPTPIDPDGEEIEGICYRNAYYERNDGIFSVFHGNDRPTLTTITPPTNTIKFEKDPHTNTASIIWEFKNTDVNNSWINIRLSTIQNVYNKTLLFNVLNTEKDRKLTYTLYIGEEEVQYQVDIPKKNAWQVVKSDLSKVANPSAGFTNIKFQIDDAEGTLYFSEIYLEKSATTGSVADQDNNDILKNYVLAFEQEVRDSFTYYNIGVNKGACQNVYSTSCTTVGGLKKETVDKLIEIKRACDDWYGNKNGTAEDNETECTMTVTGGTEWWLHSKGTRHKAERMWKPDGGKTVDLSSHSVVDGKLTTNKLTDYITQSGHFIKITGEVCSSNWELWVAQEAGEPNRNIAFRLEKRGPCSNNDSHWHAEFDNGHLKL